MRRLRAGIDVGGTNIRVAVGEPSEPTGLARRNGLVPGDYPTFLDRLADLIQATCEDAGVAPSELTAVGMGLPGTMAGGVTTFVPALPFLDGTALAADLSSRLGLDAPVHLDNDARCALRAEWRLGAAIGHEHVVLVVVGTGVGGAVLTHGTIYPGGRGAAGAFGWLAAGGVPHDRHGAWEQAVSGRALNDTAAGLGLTPAQLMVGAADGNRPSREAVDAYAYALGRGMAAIASVWDPELLVVGGVISPYFAMLSAGVTRAFDDWASPAGRQVPRVVARLGADAGVLGALCLADEQTRSAR